MQHSCSCLMWQRIALLRILYNRFRYCGGLHLLLRLSNTFLQCMMYILRMLIHSIFLMHILYNHFRYCGSLHLLLRLSNTFLQCMMCKMNLPEMNIFRCYKCDILQQCSLHFGFGMCLHYNACMKLEYFGLNIFRLHMHRMMLSHLKVENIRGCRLYRQTAVTI